MGVHGLWRLIDSSGKPVPLESLENKVLAVDISIWLYQAIKGYQDSKGASVANSHLLGVYHRLCKLLYYKIRPVFVFDGSVPALKRQTIAKRHQLKFKQEDESAQLHQQILSNLLKHTAINAVLSEKKISPKKLTKGNREIDDDSLFKLPELPSSQNDPEEETTPDESTEYTSSTTDEYSPVKKRIDMDSVDETSIHFKSLPADVRHDILTELKENSKMASWSKIRKVSGDNGDFSKLQIDRLLKRRSIQVSLEEAEKEMGGHTLSLGDLEALLTEEGIVSTSKAVAKSRIASNENTRYLYIKDVQKALVKAKKDQEEKDKLIKSEKSETTDFAEASTSNSESNPKEMSEYDRDLQEAIKLSLQNNSETETANEEQVNKVSFMENFHDGDFLSDSSSADEEPSGKSNISRNFESLARNYMTEYSDLTPAEIDRLLGINKTKPKQYYPNEMLLNSQKYSPSKKTKMLDESNMNAVKRKLDLESFDDLFSDITKTNLSSKITEISETTDQNLAENKIIETSNIEEKEKSSFQSDNDSVKFMSDSESDQSDDFIEIKGTKNEKQKNVLEVIVKPDFKLEDDIFSDIFESNPNLLLPIINDKKEEKIREITIENKLINLENLIDEELSELETKKKVEEQSRIDEKIEEENKEKEEIENKNKHQKKEEIENKSKDQEKKEIENKSKDQEKEEIEDKNKDEEKEEIENKSKDQEKEEIKIANNDKEKESTRKEIKKISAEEIAVMRDVLQKESEELIIEKANKDRMANSITDQMYQETQELLELFGVPYIVAPMEAEAQCAFLDENQLTDGTITDDSDIWLFGGNTVYKNFFNHKKHVLEFRSDNIYHYFKLSRKQLILLALLVGSDYTIGLQGVGPVTALEILAAFPPSNTDVTVLSEDDLLSGLKQFHQWWNTGRAVGPRKTALRSKLKNVTMSEGFPSSQVVKAYLEPEVEKSKEKFSWGTPDIEKLKEYARNKFGWPDRKSEEILLPVIKRMKDRESQKSIRAYFSARPEPLNDKQMSKRVKKAVEIISGDIIDDVDDFKTKKVRKKKTTAKSSNPESSSSGISVENKEKLKAFSKTMKATLSKPKKVRNEPKVVTVDVEIKPLKKLEDKVKVPVIPTGLSSTSQECIPQREKDKSDALKNRLKAIEIFRKSKQGPGYIKKRPRLSREIKEDAELSESSSDD